MLHEIKLVDPAVELAYRRRKSDQRLLFFRDPLKRFGETLNGLPAGTLDAFYAENFIDMMGNGLEPELRRPNSM